MSEIKRMEEKMRQQAMAAPLPMKESMQAGAVNLPMRGSMQAETVNLPMQEKPQFTQHVGEAEIRKAGEILQKYKSGKAKLEARMIANEKWWEGRAWNEMQSRGNLLSDRRPTMWLFNVIMGKHADMIQSYPEPAIISREKMDEKTAQMLTSILPVILEQNGYDETYDDLAWDKNKQGTAITGTFWDKSKLNGLGDVSIVQIDPMGLFWEPGITDIQKSKHVFHVQVMDKEDLVNEYPFLEGKNLKGAMTLSRYEYEDSIDMTDKALVVDWYYHVFVNGRKTLQYCKFVNDQVLYASENIPEIREKGWYEDGEYPFDVDPLFPSKGTIAGKGYIDIGKGAQETIDLLDQACVMNALAGAIPRYFSTQESGINELEMLDFTKPVVHVEGNLSENTWRPMDKPSLSGVHAQILQNKIEELKQTTGNQDVNNGMSGSVTAMGAIYALQESAGRSSRDGIQGTWRCYARVVKKVISRIAQFYDAPRTFRILGENNKAEYVEFDNKGLIAQTIFDEMGKFQGIRVPEFDISVSAQKQNAYSRVANNQLILELYNAGLMNPQMADQSILVLSMMDFPKKEELIQKIQENGTLLQQMAMWQQMALQLAAEHEPEMAEQMAAGIMGGAPGQMQMLPQAKKTSLDAGALEGENQKSKAEEKARERSAQASQPQ